jgi:hypothetical protein
MKKIIYLIISTTLALCAFNAQAARDYEACFYQHANFQGAESCYTGTVRIPFVGNNLNDQFSSLKVGKKVTATIFRDSNYNGDSKLYESNISFLNNFNDEISSFTVTEKVVRPSANQACFYQDANYQGKETCYSIAVGIPSLGDDNDQFSSIKVGSNARAIAYRHGFFNGDSEKYESNISFLNNFNDAISSFTVTERVVRPSANQACFYERKNFRGKALCFIARDIPSLEGNANFRYTSSIYGANIRSVRAFTETNFTGGNELYFIGTQDLGVTRPLNSIKIATGGFKENGNRVCFYSGQRFGFEEYCYTGSRDVSRTTNGNDSFDSVKIPNGYKVKVYNDNFFEGERRVFRESSITLGPVHSNKISSIKIRKSGDDLSETFLPNGNRVCFYGQTEFRGEGFCYSGGMSIGRLRSTAANRFRSVKIPSGLRIRVYNNVFFRGERSNIYRSTPALPAVHLSNIESIQITRNN